MTKPDSDFQSAHEVGKVYSAILEQNVLIDFFLDSVAKFIPSAYGALFLSGREKKLWLASSNNPEKYDSPSVTDQIKAVSIEGKPKLKDNILYFPLIVKNNSLGVACFWKNDKDSSFSKKDLEIGFDLTSQFSGALKNILLFEDNLKMERLAAVGQTMGMVIHEIKNILQLARLSDEITRIGIKEKKEAFVDQGLTKMNKALKSMDGFISEMLSLTKDYQLEPEDINIKNLFEELISDYKEKTKAHHVKFDFQIDEKFPIVKGDARSLYRSLLNLVKNAMEAFGGKKDACISMRAAVRDDDTYDLIVEDNGSGMRDEVKAKLFQAFFSTKGKYGTGLGLMVIDRAVKMHKGSIRVESELGKGTRFILNLPRSFS